MSRRDPYDRFTNDGGYGQPYDDNPEHWPYDQAPEQPYEEPAYEEQPYEQAYEQPYEQAYEQPYEQAYEQPYEPQYEQPYQGQAPYARREAHKPAVISTNATVNLICTLCAGCGLFGLFLFFVDRRSRAVRRFAAQSAGLLCVVAFLSAGMAILAALLGFVPFVGGALSAIVWILLAAMLCGDIYLRVRMAAHAYRGEAYVLPLIGERCRQFE